MKQWTAPSHRLAAQACWEFLVKCIALFLKMLSSPDRELAYRTMRLIGAIPRQFAEYLGMERLQVSKAILITNAKSVSPRRLKRILAFVITTPPNPFDTVQKPLLALKALSPQLKEFAEEISNEIATSRNFENFYEGNLAIDSELLARLVSEGKSPRVRAKSYSQPNDSLGWDRNFNRTPSFSSHSHRLRLQVCTLRARGSEARLHRQACG